MKWEKDRNELQKQVAELKDKLLEANVSSKDQISEMKKDMDELLQVCYKYIQYFRKRCKISNI